MIVFRDKTFCSSPHCTNECGRKMTAAEEDELVSLNAPDQWDGVLGVSYGYFCGEPEPEDDTRT